jgi:hypothetical protein
VFVGDRVGVVDRIEVYPVTCGQTKRLAADGELDGEVGDPVRRSPAQPNLRAAVA